jgi:hypothetical protein
MAQRIVDLLEIVEIQKKQCHFLAMTSCERDRLRLGWRGYYAF